MGAELQLVVLHPYQLLPNQLPLHRRGADGTWKSYIVTKDGLLRATRDPDDTDAEEFPTFTFQSSREPAEELNAWFVTMNAGIKFERFRDNYGLETLHSSMAEIANQTLEIVDLIYKRITPSTVYLRSRDSPKKRGVNYSKEGGIGMDDDGGEDGGTSGVLNKKPRYNFDDLSHEQRRALGNYLFSSASGFRQTDEDEELGGDEESGDAVDFDPLELVAKDPQYDNPDALASIVV